MITWQSGARDVAVVYIRVPGGLRTAETKKEIMDGKSKQTNHLIAKIAKDWGMNRGEMGSIDGVLVLRSLSSIYISVTPNIQFSTRIVFDGPLMFPFS